MSAESWGGYPPPPDTNWEDLQRYAATRLLADMFEADDRVIFGVLAGDPQDRWERAEAAYERLRAAG